jgi:hypothetical protein
MSDYRRLDRLGLKRQLSLAIVTTLSMCLSAVFARADQCALVSKQQALAAMSRLEVGDTIYNLCELCGEKQPSSIVIDKVELTNDPSSKLWQIEINDRQIDFAYTYVLAKAPSDRPSRSQLERNSYINLSLVARCPATGFKPILSIR